MFSFQEPGPRFSVFGGVNSKEIPLWSEKGNKCSADDLDVRKISCVR